jgi:hypothetical protein
VSGSWVQIYMVVQSATDLHFCRRLSVIAMVIHTVPADCRRLPASALWSQRRPSTKLTF